MSICAFSAPADIHIQYTFFAGYVFNGAYSPVVCRVVHELIKGGQGPAKGTRGPLSGAALVKDALKSAPGDTIVDMNSPEAPKAGAIFSPSIS